MLGPEERVELIDGVLVDVSRAGPDHAATVSWLTRQLRDRLRGLRGPRPGHAARRRRLRLARPRSVVEPVPRERPPATAALVVEVSVTTLRHDTAKAPRYACAGVGEYWLVDVAARTVRVHQEPSADGYRRVIVHGDRAVLSPPAGAPPVTVEDMLGPPVPRA